MTLQGKLIDYKNKAKRYKELSKPRNNSRDMKEEEIIYIYCDQEKAWAFILLWLEVTLKQ